MKAAGIAFRPPGGWGRQPPGKPANEVITDPPPAKPANEVITDYGVELAVPATAAAERQPGRSPSASACEPYRDAIELGLSRGRNAMAIWQELVDTCGFAAGYQSVRRFVRKLHGSQSPEACAVIEAAVGEEAKVDYGAGPMVGFEAHIGYGEHFTIIPGVRMHGLPASWLLRPSVGAGWAF